MKQFRAGYVLDNLKRVFALDGNEQLIADSLTSWLSHFSLKSATGFELGDAKAIPAQLATWINLIERGAPTFIGVDALEELVRKSTVLKFNEAVTTEIALTWRVGLDEQYLKQELIQALHSVDQRPEPERKYTYSWERLDSVFEEDFFYRILPKHINKIAPFEMDATTFLHQVLGTQRSLASITKKQENELTLNPHVRQNFKEQRTDFSIEFAYTFDSNYAKGIVIEVDGPHHQTEVQKHLDQERDNAAIRSGWAQTVRLPTNSFWKPAFDDNVNRHLLTRLSESDYFKQSLESFAKPIWKKEPKARELSELALIPFAIARIQRVIVEAIAAERILLDAPKWKLCIIEQDVPCGYPSYQVHIS